MAKVLGLRQQRVQFFYDTDFKTQGVTTSTSRDFCVPEKILFATVSGQGDLSRTNLVTPGQLSSDQTFLTFAVRHELNFFAANGEAGQSVVADTLTTVAELSVWALANSSFQYKVSEKVEFEGPLAMTPAGGGSWGYVNDSVSPLIVNGEPDAPAIYVLPLPIAVTKRQAIQMIEKKATFQAGGAVGINDINVCAAINGFEGGKMLRAYIDGYNTRDVL
jgi:hypothetical protein